MSVTDYLDCSEGRPKRIAGRTDLIRVIEGIGTARIEFAPASTSAAFPPNSNTATAVSRSQMPLTSSCSAPRHRVDH